MRQWMSVQKLKEHERIAIGKDELLLSSCVKYTRPSRDSALLDTR